MSQVDTLIRPTHAIGSSCNALPLDRDLFSAPHLSLSSDDIIPHSLLLEAAVSFAGVDRSFALNSCLAESRSWLAE
jgi:hypothetical protein